VAPTRTTTLISLASPTPGKLTNKQLDTEDRHLYPAAPTPHVSCRKSASAKGCRDRLRGIVVEAWHSGTVFNSKSSDRALQSSSKRLMYLIRPLKTPHVLRTTDHDIKHRIDTDTPGRHIYNVLTVPYETSTTADSKLPSPTFALCFVLERRTHHR
jgi:hypothetical protein